MSIGIRIKKSRLIMGVTQKEIAKMLNISAQAFSAWERDASKPTGVSVIKLAEVLSVDHLWLLFGDEPRENNKLVSSKEKVIYVKFYSNITASAGNGIENCYPEVEYYPVPESALNKQNNKQKIYCISCIGDSMEPVFYHGSVLAVNPEENVIHDGGIYVIRYNNSLRVKMLRSTYEGIIVQSYNKHYPDELIPSKENDNFEVVGKVFWFSSTLNK